ncbi:unnamed protein product [Acanthoscelides obtectus]|uniref:Uncharacterized protein n=1 Tax=Acanthoscelides obtectus TaxID=200917 RepID=A0A9P0VSJ2_ACAOB|nr:unnamed protein product [Acanthoscelides obtectus]CAK1659902.1 hypothetical protein AOBTE_LOCUS21740 [Acanthoscelides obtectus]
METWNRRRTFTFPNRQSWSYHTTPRVQAWLLSQRRRNFGLERKTAIHHEYRAFVSVADHGNIA